MIFWNYMPNQQNFKQMVSVILCPMWTEQGDEVQLFFLLFLVFSLTLFPGDIHICFSIYRRFRLRDPYFLGLPSFPPWALLFINVYKSNKGKKSPLWNKRRPLLHMSLNIFSIKFLRPFGSERSYICMIRPKCSFAIKIKSSFSRLNSVCL